MNYSHARLVLLLGLSEVPGVGNATLNGVLRATPGLSDPAEIAEEIRRASGIKARQQTLLIEALSPLSWPNYRDSAESKVDACIRLGIGLVPLDAPEYPTWMKGIHDAPAVIYSKGTTQPDEQSVACVGTRQPSHFGIRAARGISTYLAERGWTIVSGLAKGLDAEAHEAALATGSRTVAILGCGLDRVYPAENRKLANDIVERGGQLFAEVPPGSEPLPRNLVQRDRLQSGMSVGVIVCETSTTGGARHAARAAREQGRMVIVPVPPPKYANLESSSGNWMLLNEGAERLEHRDQYGEIDLKLHRKLSQMRQTFGAAIEICPPVTDQGRLL